MVLSDNSGFKSEELYKISLDAVDEGADVAWHSLLHNLSDADLENLQAIFKRKCDEEGLEVGLKRNEFLEAICSFFEGPQYSLQANMLFDEISQNMRQTITWNDFLDFCIEFIYPEIKRKLRLTVSSIETVAHAKNESVAKIVLIETEQYFCYAIVLKHGRVGLYNGNLDFLTSYHAIMTREDLTRPEDERRRRNRWVTDALFCQDTLMFIITNTARSIIIYEASGLKHVPFWLILSTPNILECLSYKPYQKLEQSTYSHSILFAGNCNGEVISFRFLQPKNELLRRKRNDNVSLFYWNDFLKEKTHVIVKSYGQVHKESVKNIKYFEEAQLLLTCSKDPSHSVALKHIENKRKTVFYKVPRGVSCFAYSTSSKILITGSDNGIIRLWNTFISKSIANFAEYQCEVVDLQVMESQQLFLSCSADAVLKMWDLRQHTCLQTIKLKFPSFRIHGKLIEWGISCIYPGPKRKQPEDSRTSENTSECFGISSIHEMKLENDEAKTRWAANNWERSCILVTCCNYIASLRTHFTEASIEYSFTYPVLPPPPLQNSVLIPLNWGLESESSAAERFEKQLGLNVEKQLQDLKFILDKNILEEIGTKSDINYKIAILESKKETMRSKVALGSPYLALDLHDIPELKLAADLPIHNNRNKTDQYVQSINQLLENAAYKDGVFSSPESSTSRSKSNKSTSIVELPY